MVAASKGAGVHAALASGRYAFVDVGCGDGGSMNQLSRRFGRTPGLGLDSDRELVDAARVAGFDALVCDLVAPDVVFPEQTVEFAAAMDVLEHLPSERDVVSVLRQLWRVAREFVFIRHPSFEDVAYLASLGLKFNWTDWTEHPTMLKLDDYRRIFAELGWTDYSIVPHMRYLDSRHDSVVPIGAPRDTMRYDAAPHGRKPIVELDRPVWGKFDIFVKRNPDVDEAAWRRLTRIDGWEAHWEF